jgi:hypothetical protein
MTSVEQLMKEVLALPNTSRALFAEKLVESLEFNIDENIDKAWVNEAQKRHQEIREGKVTPISGEEALAQVREILNK